MTTNETYWALEEDWDALLGNLNRRIDQYYQLYRRTTFFDWQKKSWRLYHNLKGQNKREIGLKSLGKQGEYVGIGVNHYRNLLQHLLNIVTGDRPVIETLPINDDVQSKQQALLADDIINYYLTTNRIDSQWIQCIEEALVLSEGYFKVTWAIDKGQEAVIDKDKPIYEGDLSTRPISITDIVYDRQYAEWQDIPWVVTREVVNKWDLVERFPEYKDKILSTPIKETGERQLFRDEWNIILANSATTLNLDIEDADQVVVYEFWHKQTDAIPEGRYTKFIEGQILLDMSLPFSKLPVRRVSPGRTLLCMWGYTPGYDLIALQEAIDIEMSSILTNHKNCAVSNVICQEDEEYDVGNLGGAGRAIYYKRTPPQFQNQNFTPAEVLQFPALLVTHMEYLSGVNSVARGQPEASLKSGTALALIDAKAIQFASNLNREYYNLIEDSTSQMVDLIKYFAINKKILTIVGNQRRGVHLISYEGKDIANVSRVRVITQNPLARTPAGRLELARMLWEMFGPTGQIRPEEIVNVIETGRYNQMIAPMLDQLTLAEMENEFILAGKPIICHSFDNHALHIKKHMCLTANPVARNNPQLLAQSEAHIMDHMQKASKIDPNLAQFLGYQPLLPPMVPGGGIEQLQPASQSQQAAVGNMELPLNPQERPEVQVPPPRPAQLPNPPTV